MLGAVGAPLLWLAAIDGVEARPGDDVAAIHQAQRQDGLRAARGRPRQQFDRLGRQARLRRPLPARRAGLALDLGLGFLRGLPRSAFAAIRSLPDGVLVLLADLDQPGSPKPVYEAHNRIAADAKRRSDF